MKKFITLLIAILSVAGISAEVSEDVTKLLTDSKECIRKEKYEAAISLYRAYVKMGGERVAEIENVLKRYVEEKETNVSGNILDYQVNNTVEIRTINYDNGDKYVGEYKDGKRHGKGTYYFVSGNRYEGEWQDGKYNGRGTFYWADGNRYEGEWQDGKYNGRGTFYWADGNRYEGEYKDDKRHGQGTYYYADGDRYVGEYKDDKRHGQGTMYFKDGTSKSGRWDMGKFVK